MLPRVHRVRATSNALVLDQLLPEPSDVGGLFQHPQLWPNIDIIRLDDMCNQPFSLARLLGEATRDLQTWLFFTQQPNSHPDGRNITIFFFLFFFLLDMIRRFFYA